MEEANTPYGKVTSRIEEASGALERGEYWVAEIAVLGGWREIGRLYRDAQATGASEEPLREYNAQLVRLEGQILARSGKKGLSVAYREGKRLATTGLESLLGTQRMERVRTETRGYADTVSAGARGVAAEVKDAYGDAKAGLANVTDVLSRKLKKLSRRLGGE